MVSPSTFSQFVQLVRQQRPRVAIILGSGLGSLAEAWGVRTQVPYGIIPDLEAPTAAGHAGTLQLAEWSGRPVLVFAGRLHYYEGQPWRRVVEPVHVARRLGVEVLLVTNASGGIRADLGPGSLLAIEGHFDWTRPLETLRAAQGVPAPRRPYSPRLLGVLQQAAQEIGLSLPRGIYAQVTGPCYETPAEIRALRTVGADAVGMSTVREIEAAHEVGLECAAISCVANRAAGLAAGPITHAEVLANIAAQRERLGRLFQAFLTKEL